MSLATYALKRGGKGKRTERGSVEGAIEDWKEERGREKRLQGGCHWWRSRQAGGHEIEVLTTKFENTRIKWWVKEKMGKPTDG